MRFEERLVEPDEPARALSCTDRLEAHLKVGHDPPDLLRGEVSTPNKPRQVERQHHDTEAAGHDLPGPRALEHVSPAWTHQTVGVQSNLVQAQDPLADLWLRYGRIDKAGITALSTH